MPLGRVARQSGEALPLATFRAARRAVVISRGQLFALQPHLLERRDVMSKLSLSVACIQMTLLQELDTAPLAFDQHPGNFNVPVYFG